MPNKDKDEIIDSETKNDDLEDDETSNEDDENESPKSNSKEGDTSTQDEDDTDEGDQDLPDYRKVDDVKKETEPETVPLKKYLQVKKELKELKTSSQSNSLSNADLKEFAEEAGLDLAVVQKMAAIIAKQAKDEVTHEVEEKVKPLLNEKIQTENNKLFEKDFQEKIVSKYPELAEKIETFRKVAFSKDFLHLRTLDDIRKEFFPSVSKKADADSIEGGSVGGDNLPEKIDFNKVESDDELHRKVLADPKLRKQYYAFKDSGGL